MQLPYNMKYMMFLKALTNERCYKIFLYYLAPTLFQSVLLWELLQKAFF